MYIFVQHNKLQYMKVLLSYFHSNSETLLFHRLSVRAALHCTGLYLKNRKLKITK